MIIIDMNKSFEFSELSCLERVCHEQVQLGEDINNIIEENYISD